MTGSWRRSRPFWGGLLVLLAGLELLSIPFATQALPLVIQSGAVGATYLISLVLIILGLMIWLQPGQRAFLGVVAVLVSIASFVYANLGGFLLGMLLGLVGGALAVAWSPGQAAETGPAAFDAEPSAAFGEGEITFTERRVVSGDEVLDATRPEPVADPAAAPAADAPRVLVGRVREAPGPRDAGASDAAPGASRGSDAPEGHSGHAGREDGHGDGHGAGRLGDEAGDGSTGDDDHDHDHDDDGDGRGGGVRPDGGPGSAGPGPGSGSGSGPGFGGPGGAAGRALAIAVLPVILMAGTGAAREDPGGSLLPGAVPSVLPSVLPSALPSIVPSDLSGVLGSVGGSVGDTAGSLTGKGRPSGGPSPSPGGAEPGSSGSGGSRGTPVVAVEAAAVRAPSLTMTGMKFTGVVDMPTATGSVKMLRFTMNKAVLEQPQQTMGATTLTGSTFTFEGNVVICTTKMTAKLLGVPQEFTAENPNLLVRALKLVPSLNVPLTMTDIVSEQPYVTADSLRADDLHLVVGA